MLKTNIFFLLILICADLAAQNFSYTNYDIKDGLAGSNVYAAAQDKEGFIWFATETGVSRFDGRHFKNFKIEDGLPDNEILNVYCDSKGRLWIMPFRKTICYYYKNKLHTQQNDSMLKRLQLTGNIYFIVEDKNGDLVLAELYKLHFIRKGPSGGFEFETRDIATSAMATDSSGTVWVFSLFDLFKIDKSNMVHIRKYPKKYEIPDVSLGKNFIAVRDVNKIRLLHYSTNTQREMNSAELNNGFSFLSDTLLSENTYNGAFIYDLTKASLLQQYLPGKTIQRVFKDKENNLWFCTQSEGVFKLNSPFVSNHLLYSKTGKKLSAHSLAKFQDKLWIGADEGHLFTLNPFTARSKMESYTNYTEGIPRNITRVLITTRSNKLLIGMQRNLVTTASEKLKVPSSLKDVALADNDNVLLCTSSGVWVLSEKTLHRPLGMDDREAIWRERSTTAHYRNDTFYIGTIDGLYRVTKDNKKYFTGNDDPLLKSRIAAIRETPDGTMWIATYDRGIIAYKNRKVILHLTREKGLSSNISRCLFVSGNDLWVGTDNGLNKISINGSNFRVTKYTTTDGLLSNFINAVCVDDSLVYVGTPEGVSYFDNKKISQQAPCILRLTNITVSGASIDPGNRSFILARRDNNIRFEYAGISYRSGGEIMYRYRLSGLDTGWQSTTNNFLNYPTLLPKNYVMELQAINKFGIASEIISIPFTIKKYWWEKIWVQLIGVSLVLVVLAFFMNRRIKQVRVREKEKNLLREQVSSLEQMALKAQMNPHFIFNSLNSIQHYVMDKDVVGANNYIADFSRLIRLTLDNSSKSEISIEEEVEYLSLYLELEKMRMGNKFTYSINMNDEIIHDGYSISPMILQPFVENSIRHGIRYRNDSNGHIKIDIEHYKSGLRFIVEDNGVGRQVAESYKSKNPIEYQSKGISLTKQRISLMNVHRKEKIEMMISDVKENGNVAGTKVVINYPFDNTETYDQYSNS